MMETFFKRYTGELISSLIALLVGWFSKGLMTKNQIVSMYQNVLDDLNKRFEQKYQDLKREHEAYRLKTDKKLKRMENAYLQCKKDNDQLRFRNQALQKKVDRILNPPCSIREP